MLEINNLTKFRVERKSFTQVAKKVLSGENRETENISLAFVTKEEMRKLNKEHRGKDEPTDVLSFEGINEVVICPEVVSAYAGSFGETKKELNKEMMMVFIHGILHLLGYDHEKSEKEADIMEEKQNFYLKDIK